MSVPQCGQVTVASARFGGLDNSPAIALPSAVLTNAVNLECVTGRQVMVLAPDFLFDFSDFWQKKLDRSPALRANHVMVTSSVVLVLEAGDPIVEGDLASESASGQQFQRPVHGRKTNARVFLLDQLVQFIGGKMLASLKKRPQNRVTLARLLQPDAAKML